MIYQLTLEVQITSQKNESKLMGKIKITNLFLRSSVNMMIDLVLIKFQWIDKLQAFFLRSNLSINDIGKFTSYQLIKLSYNYVYQTSIFVLKYSLICRIFFFIITMTLEEFYNIFQNIKFKYI